METNNYSTLTWSSPCPNNYLLSRTRKDIPHVKTSFRILTGSPLATTALAMSARFFLTYGVNAATQFSFEIVPTTLRGQVRKKRADMARAVVARGEPERE